MNISGNTTLICADNVGERDKDRTGEEKKRKGRRSGWIKEEVSWERGEKVVWLDERERQRD